MERALHAAIRQVSEDLEALSYNTAIAAMMDYLNTLRFGGRTASIDEVRPLVILLAPVAPHIAEELWARLGEESSVFDHAEWPAWDERKLAVDEVELPVQVNGRLRATIRVARGAPEAVVREAALAEANVIRRLDGAEIPQGDPHPGPHAEPRDLVVRRPPGTAGGRHHSTEPSSSVSMRAGVPPSPKRKIRRFV